MREILAREFYGDGVGDLYMQLREHEAKVGVPLAVDNLDNLATELYTHKYYPGKYLPHADRKPKVKDVPSPANRLSEITQGAGWGIRATFAHYRYKRMLQRLAVAS